MLHRSFKPEKCKTSLKLVVSRIKVLKNQRGLHINKIKRELAQLLDSGQVQTARIRVEHVTQEEKIMTAYELLELYCELIAQRMPIIESHRNCPIDLKEAISGVIFASPRCADIPELMDIRKHFSGKYGKEFVSAAVELRPDCGVNRLLVEKLSTKAPDGQTKIKILSKIAQEHNVKWDPDSFAERDSLPSEDLLNGPNTFQTASKNQMGLFPGSAPPVNDGNKPPVVQVPPKHEGAGSRQMEHNQSSSRDRNSFSSEGQNLNMPFKDAASAAQAAALSAEQASIAARAAAELSGQYSSEPQQSSGHVSKYEMPQKYDKSESRGEYDDEGTQIVDKNQVDLHERFLRLKALTCGIEINRLVDDGQSEDTFPKKKSSEPKKSDFSGEQNKKTQPGESETTSVSHMQNSLRSEKNTYYDDERTIRRSNEASSYSHSSFFSGENEVVQEKNEPVADFGDIRTEEQYDTTSSGFLGNICEGNDPGENPFVNNEACMKEINCNENTSVVFDDFGSDDENYMFDVGSHVENKSSSYSGPWSSRKDADDVMREPISQSHSSLRDSTATLQQNDSLPVVFDDSDGQSSDGEEDLGKSKFVVNSGHDEFGKSESGLNVENFLSPDLSDTLDDPVFVENTSLGSGKELNFGSLTGGFRNKGYKYPPYTRKSSGGSLSSKQATDDNQEPYNQKESSKPYKSISARTRATYVDSDDDPLEDEPQQLTSSNNLEQSELNKRASSSVPVTYFDSESSDSEEYIPRVSSSTIGRPGSGFSRRTKVSSSRSGKSHPKTTVFKDPTPEFATETKSHPTSSGSEVTSNIRSSDDSRGQGQSGLVQRETSRQIPDSTGSSFTESSKSLTTEHSETSKSPVLTGQTSLKDKASHVHPKLPDYDSLTAQFQSLRQDG